MSFIERYEKTDGGHRLVPDGAGGLKYTKQNNETLRRVPDRDRLLAVYCHAQQPPRLVAVVTRDWQVHVLAGRPDATATPGRLHTHCRCGPDGHQMSLAKLTQATDRLAHVRDPKGRRVDVRRVSDD